MFVEAREVTTMAGGGNARFRHGDLPGWRIDGIQRVASRPMRTCGPWKTASGPR